MSKKRSIFQRIGSFRLTIIAALVIFCHCFLAGFEPGIAFFTSVAWPFSIILGLASCVGQAIDNIKAEMGRDSCGSWLLLNRFIASFLLFFVVFGFQYSIGMFGAWTRVMLYGGSGKARASMMPLFDQYPVDEDVVLIEEPLIPGLGRWAKGGGSRFHLTVWDDRISVFPRFFAPIDAGRYILMKDPDDRPEAGPYNVVYQHFGNGLWFVADDC